MSNFPPPDFMVKESDLAFLILADQIASDYMGFVKRLIIPEMDVFEAKSLRELRVLMTLNILDTPVPARRVAEILRFDPATVSRATRHLLEQGLIEECQNEDDLRTLLLSPTDDGRAVGEKYLKLVKTNLEKVSDSVSELNEGEKSILLSAMLKVRKRSVRLATASIVKSKK